MRLLIPMFLPPTGTWGGLTRVIAVADAALAAGHEVACCAAGALADDLDRRGYRVYRVPAPSMLGLPKPVSRRIERRSQRITPPMRRRSIGSVWLVLMFSGYANAGFLRRLVDAELRAVHDFRPDALFTDLDVGAGVLHRVTGLPLALAYQGIMEQGRGSLPWRLMRRAENAVLQDHGHAPTTPDALYFGADVLKLIPSIPELDGTDPDRPDVFYAGQLLGDFKPAAKSDWQPEPGRRYVFTYVGTGALSLHALEAVLPQVFPAEGNLRCVVGSQSIETPYTKGGVEFRPFVPADALLPHGEWTICHGGQNTIVQSLRHGVPLLIFLGPIFERRFNARKVAEAGAGLMAEADDFNPGWLRAALAKRATYASGAQRLGARIAAYGGAEAAVSAIATWIARDTSARLDMSLPHEDTHHAA
jgi:hypothetical protein